MNLTRWLGMGAVAFGGVAAFRKLTTIPMRLAGRTVLITGGSRGLGLELARRCLVEGAKVVICARSVKEIHRAVEHLSTISPDVLGLAGDVRDPEQCRTLVRRTVDWSGRLDVLINNAGVIQVGPMQSLTEQDFRDAFDTHLWGPLQMTATALPHLRRSDAARIVNIASVGGLLAAPHMLPYSASKFGLVGLSQGMRIELKRLGVTVTTVCPGLMRTGSTRHAVVAGDLQAEYAWFSILSALPGLSISSSRAARQILAGMRAGKAQVVMTIPARIAARVHDLMPALMAELKEWVNSALPNPVERTTLHAPGSECTSGWSPSWLTTLSDRAAVRNFEDRSTNGFA